MGARPELVAIYEAALAAIATGMSPEGMRPLSKLEMKAIAKVALDDANLRVQESERSRG